MKKSVVETPEACGQAGPKREPRIASQVLRTLPCISGWDMMGIQNMGDQAQVLILRSDAGIGGEVAPLYPSSRSQ